MSNAARVGVFGLMVLAIALSRLIEVEMRPQALTVGRTQQEATAPSKPQKPGKQPSPEQPDEALPSQPQAAPAARPQEGRTYVVQPGDTLGAISKKAYGTTRHWRAILDANRDAIPSESKMRAGATLRLPDIPR